MDEDVDEGLPNGDADGQPGGQVEDAGPPAVELTGHPQVDAVLQSLDELDSRPLPAQVRMFESAHERLRAALSDAANSPADSPAAHAGPRSAG